MKAAGSAFFRVPTFDRFKIGQLTGWVRAVIKTRFPLLGPASMLWSLLTTACDDQTTALPPIPSAEEVQATIRTNIQYENGLLLIRDSLLPTLVVVPANSPWAVKCGLGLTIFFGRDGETSTQVRISYRLIPHEICRELAPLAAHAVATIAGGQANPGSSKRLDPAGFKP